MTSKTSAHRTKALRAKSPQIKTSRTKIARNKTWASKTSHAKSSRDKVRAHRKRMRAKGFRLVQMWLPDTRTPEFAAQAHRDSLAIANNPTEKEDQAFVDSISWWNSAEATSLSKSEGSQIWWRTKERSD